MDPKEIERAITTLALAYDEIRNFDGLAAVFARKTALGAVGLDSTACQAEGFAAKPWLKDGVDTEFVDAKALGWAEALSKLYGGTSVALPKAKAFLDGISAQGFVREAAAVTKMRLSAEAHVYSRAGGVDADVLNEMVEGVCADLDEIPGVGESANKLAYALNNDGGALRPGSLFAGYDAMQPYGFKDEYLGDKLLGLWQGGAKDSVGDELSGRFKLHRPLDLGIVATDVSEVMYVASEAGVPISRVSTLVADCRESAQSGTPIAFYDDYTDTDKAIVQALGQMRYEAVLEGIVNERFAQALLVGSAIWRMQLARAAAHGKRQELVGATLGLIISVLVNQGTSADDAFRYVLALADENHLKYDVRAAQAVLSASVAYLDRLKDAGADGSVLNVYLDLAHRAIGSDIRTNPVAKALGLVDDAGYVHADVWIPVVEGIGDLM